MANLGVAAAATLALMLFLLAIAEASVFHTMVTTTDQEVNQAGSGSVSQRCRQEILQRRQQLQHCQDYLSTQTRDTPSSSYWTIRSVVMNPHQQKQQEVAHLMECCVALHDINDPQCRCEAVDQALKQEEQQSGRQPQLVETARNLPGKCDLDPQQCQIQEDLF